MITEVYAGITTGRGIMNHVESIGKMFQPGSLEYSYTWALQGIDSDSKKKPPHLTLLPRTSVDPSMEPSLLNLAVLNIGRAVVYGAKFTLIPQIDPLTYELFAKPDPDSLEIEVLDAMTDLFVRDLKIARYKYSYPHLKLARLNQNREYDFNRINTVLSAFPIYFYPSLVYATLHRDNNLVIKSTFSIARQQDI